MKNLFDLVCDHLVPGEKSAMTISSEGRAVVENALNEAIELGHGRAAAQDLMTAAGFLDSRNGREAAEVVVQILTRRVMAVQRAEKMKRANDDQRAAFERFAGQSATKSAPRYGAKAPAGAVSAGTLAMAANRRRRPFR